MKKVQERLLDYVKVWTTSDDASETSPSTERQFDLAHRLVEEMKALGIADARVDGTCYVYGSAPATKGYEDRPAIGLIAHMDTAPDASGENVRPQIIPDYDGGDVQLGASGLTLRTAEFPHLKELKGRTLITTDGTTLLGADDKAGIAEILTAVEEILAEGTPHGRICIAFTPDEEIARGTEHFDLEAFGADYAYTLDGSREGEIQYENFNAANAFFTIRGVNVHPGSAKGIMVNAQTLAAELHGMIPRSEAPETTEGYEGFYHLQSMSGSVELAKLRYLIRDHDAGKFKERQEFLRNVEKTMCDRYGAGVVELKIEESYRNMKEKVEPCFHLIEHARAAIESVGLTPDESPVRGGTDGATLSFMGLPCPNLGTGGFAFHGPFEHITVEGMELSVRILKEILRRYAEGYVR